jgi:copper transporter 1
MLFTWDWKNTCIVFKWWHVKTFWGFIGSFLAIVLLTAGYEFVKFCFQGWERSYSSTLSGASINASNTAIGQYRLKKSMLYGFQVGYSFLLMLVFMTYNGWFMVAVAVGAAIGNWVWGTSSTYGRDLSCH